MYGFILADIPGLIEGASEGKGLGHKFLRHIKRTKILFHCISLESDDVVRDYEVVRKELGSFNKELLEKQEIIILTKTDVVTPEKVAEQLKKIKKLKKDILTVSVYDLDAIKRLQDSLTDILRLGMKK